MKINRTVNNVLLLLFFSSLGFADNTAPSNDEVQNLWKKNSKEEMTITGKPLQIGLRNKEVAYLIPVGFYGRGRNFISNTVMVRPLIKEVREIEEPVCSDSISHDLNHDGISEIETVSLGSGQGTTHGEKSIVQFRDWKPIVLHRKEFYYNSGCCGPPPGGCGRCESQEVQWKFADFNHDGKDDLIEEIVMKLGATQKKTVKKYLFNNSTFTRLNGRQITATILRQRLQAAGVKSSVYSIEGDPLPTEYGGVLDRVSGYWRIRDYDRGNFTNDRVFTSENEACAYFFDETMPNYVPWDNRRFFKQRYNLEW